MFLRFYIRANWFWKYSWPFDSVCFYIFFSIPYWITPSFLQFSIFFFFYRVFSTILQIAANAVPVHSIRRLLRHQFLQLLPRTPSRRSTRRKQSYRANYSPLGKSAPSSDRVSFGSMKKRSVNVEFSSREKWIDLLYTANVSSIPFRTSNVAKEEANCEHSFSMFSLWEGENIFD